MMLTLIYESGIMFLNQIFRKANNVFGGNAMTIYDAGKTLSFNVIGYENDKEIDDYD